MANTSLNSDRYRYISIDTAPGASGAWSDAVSMSAVKGGPIWFSRRGGGNGTVTIQYKTKWDTEWRDLTTDVDLADGVRCILDDMGAGVAWRAGIKSGGYTDGTIIVGFDW